MSSAYGDAAQCSGTGTFVRMKAIVESHTSIQKLLMFDSASQKLLADLMQLRVSMESIFDF